METSHKIFVVDDDPFSLNSYVEQLKSHGYSNVNAIRSAEECLRHLTEKPDVIFLDHNMEDMNGLDLLKKIKHFYPTVKVVIVTGQKDVHIAVNAFKCGAHDYILKGEEEVKQMKRVLGTIRIKPKNIPTPKSLFHRIMGRIRSSSILQSIGI